MRFLFILLFCPICSIAQSTLTDSVKLALRAECARRMDLEQMVEFPEFWQRATDSMRAVRGQYLADNFRWLIAITDQYGFPVHTALSLPADTANGAGDDRWQLFASSSLRHTFSLFPKLMTDPAVVELFRKELQAGRLPIQFLRSAATFYQYGDKRCIQDREAVNQALLSWGLEPLDSKHFYVCPE